ncbi:MAG: hypothetical protein AB8A46_04295 [Prochlorococcus sp.]|jgi:hypothetical protein|nr:hypothetical protein [Prochlorococcaceae cyanobacterium ETNP18_MAG_1]
MATIQDHDFVKICAELASCLSISLSSARRKVELAASQANAKGLDAQKSIAQGLLEEARSRPQKGEGSPGTQLDQLLEAVASDENFMVED